jgi:branched-chain amino acid transport system permease protein
MRLIEIVVNSLVPASLYTLIGVSFVLVYRTTQVLNFALGQLLLIAGLVFFSFSVGLNSNFAVSMVGLVIVGLLLGLVIYLTLLRPMTGQGHLVVVMFTIILGTILQSLGGIIWGTASKSIPNPFGQKGIPIVPGASLSSFDFVVIGTAAIVIVAVGVFVRFSAFGIAMRATAEHPTLASYRGVNVIRVAAIAWSISVAIAFLAGAFIGMRSTVDVSIVGLGFVGFAAILVGGMDSILGALVGALIVAIIQAIATTFLGGEWSEVSAFAVLLVALIIRPYGLFGTPEFMRL